MSNPLFQVMTYGAVVLTLVFGGAVQSAEIGKSKSINQPLAQSSSPYLRSHKRDLVRWHLWSDETFELARKADKPVLVSFGYTACHWCHVMQETHFNDVEMAKHINEEFIPVLVDRERRIALDELYLLVTEALTQQAGWPNTVFLNADREPYYATTYVPKDQFGEILDAVVTAWTSDRNSIEKEADRLAGVLNAYTTRKEKAATLSETMLHNTAREIASQFDRNFGGMGQQAKFYRQPLLMFLLQQAEKNQDGDLLEPVAYTLQSMLSGGVNDQIAGGFHRYSVDPAWLVPHFEKMLYDQGQLAELYTRAYQLTALPQFKTTAIRTLNYVLDDLTAPHGGFWSTRDADSEGEEGTFYVWTPEQLTAILGKNDAEFAIRLFGVIPGGEFEGKVVLNLYQATSGDEKRLNRVLDRLADVRKTRIHPVRDEKTVVSWNGLTISAFSRAGNLFDEPQFIEAARRAGEFIWKTMRLEDGRLNRIYFQGKAEIAGELDDYAHLARGYIALFDATADRVWLDRAVNLEAAMARYFSDPEAGDYYSTKTADGFGRFKPRRDIDLPSGNGVVLEVLLALSKRTGKANYVHKAERLIADISGIAAANPQGSGSLLAGAHRLKQGETGIVQYGGEGAVRVEARVRPGTDKVKFRLTIAEGWHINAAKPLDDNFIATSLTVKDGSNAPAAPVLFPKPTVKSLSFNNEPLALFENEVELSVDLSQQKGSVVSASLEIQACSDRLCLFPEKITMSLPRLSP
ncbi:MAG: DUF255 domain-containing protein [Pseudomonadota bacterium]